MFKIIEKATPFLILAFSLFLYSAQAADCAGLEPEYCSLISTCSISSNRKSCTGNYEGHNFTNSSGLNSTIESPVFLFTGKRIVKQDGEAGSLTNPFSKLDEAIKSEAKIIIILNQKKSKIDFSMSIRKSSILTTTLPSIITLRYTCKGNSTSAINVTSNEALIYKGFTLENKNSYTFLATLTAEKDSNIGEVIFYDVIMNWKAKENATNVIRSDAFSIRMINVQIDAYQFGTSITNSKNETQENTLEIVNSTIFSSQKMSSLKSVINCTNMQVFIINSTFMNLNTDFQTIVDSQAIISLQGGLLGVQNSIFDSIQSNVFDVKDLIGPVLINNTFSRVFSDIIFSIRDISQQLIQIESTYSSDSTSSYSSSSSSSSSSNNTPNYSPVEDDYENAENDIDPYKDNDAEDEVPEDIPEVPYEDSDVDDNEDYEDPDDVPEEVPDVDNDDDVNNAEDDIVDDDINNLEDDDAINAEDGTVNNVENDIVNAEDETINNEETEIYQDEDEDPYTSDDLVFLVKKRKKIRVRTYYNNIPAFHETTENFDKSIFLPNMTKNASAELYQNTFKDITVLKTSVYVGGIQIFIDRLHMKRVAFYQRQNDKDYKPPEGICIYGLINQMSINYSIFESVSSACVQFIGIPNNNSQIAAFNISNSTFQNNKLAKTDTQQIYKDFSGVSWLTIGHSSPTSGLQIETNVRINVTIFSNIFLANSITAENGGALRVLKNVVFDSFQFEDNIIHRCQAKEGGGIRVLNAEAQLYKDNFIIIIRNNLFSHTKSTYDGGAVSIKFDENKNKQARLYENIFACSSSAIGGAIYALITSYEVYDNTFYGNIASFGGVAFVNLVTSGSNYENYFGSNVGLSEGVILYRSKKKFYTKDFAKDSIIRPTRKGFLRRFPQLHLKIKVYQLSGNMNFLSSIPPYVSSLRQILSEDNSTSGFIRSVEYYNSTNITNKVFTVPHGSHLREFIGLELVDSEENIYDKINGYDIDFDLYPGQIIRGQSGQIENGTLYIHEDLVINGESGQMSHLTITPGPTIISLFSYTSNALSLKINFTHCQKGEIYSHSLSACQECPNATYSIDDPYNKEAQCHTCPENAFCYGEQLLIPAKGYSRHSSDSENVLQCSNMNSCLGGINEETHSYKLTGFCGENFHGPLCSACTSGFALDSSQNCKSCQYDTRFFMGFVYRIGLSLFLVFLSLSNGFVSQKEFEDAHNKNDKQLIDALKGTFNRSTIVRIVVGFIQMSQIIIALKFNILSVALNFFEIASDTIPLVFSRFDTDCLLQFLQLENSKAIYYRFLLEILSIATFCMIFLIYYGLKFGCKKSEKRVSEKLGLCILIIVYLKQPGVLIEALNLFSCQEVGDGRYFLTKDLSVQCYTVDYYIWSWGVGITFTFLLGIYFPYYLYKKYNKNLETEHWNIHYSKNSLFLAGYRKEYHFWEFIIMLQKIMMVLIVIIFGQDTLVSGILIAVILIVALNLNMSLWIYESPELGNLQKISLSSILLFVLVSIYLTQNEGVEVMSRSKYAMGVLGLAAIICAIVFIIQATYLIWKTSYRTIGKAASYLEETLTRKQTRSKSLSYDISFIEDENNKNLQNKLL